MSIPYLDEFGKHGVVVGAAIGFLYLLYLRALPQPIPGIPYNEESAKRLMGDIPGFTALEKDGKRPREFWTQLARRHNSPISQFFLFPFSRPTVVIADFRECQSLLLHRDKQLEHGDGEVQGFGGALPSAFISMRNSDPGFKHGRGLVKDLMTPSFLYSVNAPEIYAKALSFIEMWRYKASIANGSPFNAVEDLNCLTSDIIEAVALGLGDDQCQSVNYLHTLQSSKIPQPSSQDEVCPFPEFTKGETLQVLTTLSEAVGKSFSMPSPWLFHKINNLRPEMRKAHAGKKALLQRYIKESEQRVLAGTDLSSPLEDGPQAHYRAAVDWMISRELAHASKQGRRPETDSPQVHDELFTYLVAGQETVHSVLSYAVKLLTANPRSQSVLRENLQRSHSVPFAAKRVPTVQEIIRTPVPYLEAFVQEVLRFRPPPEGVGKTTKNDMVILGHFIPRGTNIWFCATGPSFNEPGFSVEDEKRFKGGRHESGNDDSVSDWNLSDFAPGEFHPERWLKVGTDGVQTFDRNAGPLMAFSLGSRACWGKRLAYLEMRIVITMLVWNFQFGSLSGDLESWEAFDMIIAKPKKTFVRLKAL